MANVTDRRERLTSLSALIITIIIIIINLDTVHHNMDSTTISHLPLKTVDI